MTLNDLYDLRSCVVSGLYNLEEGIEVLHDVLKENDMFAALCVLHWLNTHYPDWSKLHG